MRLWRITRRTHVTLDGEGPRLYGARWNSPGTPVVYAASHLSLAALEYLVHIDMEETPDDLVALRISVPNDATEMEYGAADLPAGWQRTPPPAECQVIGDDWAKTREDLLLRVPSVLVPEESNVLVNPIHLDAARVRVAGFRPFFYDPRLLVQSWTWRAVDNPRVAPRAARHYTSGR